jgi:hypothetical protein
MGGGNPLKKIEKETKRAVKKVSKETSRIASQIEDETKRAVGTVADKVFDIEPPKPVGQSEVAEDGASQVVDEVGTKDGDEKKKRKTRTKKGKLKVPTVPKQTSTGVKV